MTISNYKLTRSDAASFLDISTRTLDRYIRSGKLSYKKISNRVYLSKDEISGLKEEIYSWVNKDIYYTDVIWNKKYDSDENAIQNPESFTNENLENFYNILREKDKQIEEKNQLIYTIQKKIWEYQTKLQNTVALPDYKAEKENHNIEREKLKLEKQQIDEELRKERIKNLIYTSVLIFFALLFIFWLF